MNAQVKTPFGFTKEKFAVVLDIHREFFPNGVQSLTSAIYDSLPCCYLKTTVTGEKDWAYGYSDNDKLLSQIQFEQVSEDQYKISVMRGCQARVRFEENEPHEPWEYFKIIPLNIEETTGTFDEIIQVYRNYEQSRFDVIQKHGHLMG